MNVRALVCFIALCVSFTSLAFADGMYLPLAEKLPKERIEKLGIHLTPEQIEEIGQGAVARLSGCSSTFMSENGILGTNWHCAAGCVNRIQQMSRIENGKEHPLSKITETGYIATSQKEELKCDGETARVPFEIQNISKKFLDLLDDDSLSPKERNSAIRKRRETLREECMKGQENLVCDVEFMNNEKDPFYLFKYRKYTDVRLVWAVPDIVGGFGGNVDNWEYPRHAGDFAFLRVYQNGKPVQPKTFVPASSDGIQPGDPQFILGYPGSTERNITSAQAHFMSDMELPYMHYVYGELMGAIKEVTGQPKESAYKSSWARLDNYYENFKRKADLIKELEVAKEKASQERWKKKKYLKEIKKIVQNSYDLFPTLYVLNRLTDNYPTYGLRAASYIWQWNTQPKDDKDREKDTFKSWNKDLLQFKIRSADDAITFEGEKKLAATYFRLADALKLRIPTIDALQKRTKTYIESLPESAGKNVPRFKDLFRMSLYEQMAEVLYKDTQMLARSEKKKERKRAQELREKMFKMTPQELVEMGDPLLLFAKGLVEDLKDLKSDYELGARFVYELPFLNYKHNLIMGAETPDANFTLRFTASTVQEKYEPIYKKGVFPHATTVAELIAKDKMLEEGHPEYVEFVVPDYLKKAHKRLNQMKDKFYYDKKLKGIPVNFITQHIITGGNSGSGVFNAKGKIVGFAFDGTPESILDDVQLHPKSRTILVDIRYVGFLGNEVFPKAKSILKEIGLPTYDGQS